MWSIQTYDTKFYTGITLDDCAQCVFREKKNHAERIFQNDEHDYHYVFEK